MTYTLWRNEYAGDELLATYQYRTDAQADHDALQEALDPASGCIGYSILEDEVLPAPSGVLTVYKGGRVRDVDEAPKSTRDLRRDSYLRHDIPREMREVGEADVVYTDGNTLIVRGTNPEKVLTLLQE